MAHGPCGDEFRAAFSCFVYSKEEPKGMDCIERFKGMQDCFREHPDVYGGELEDEDEEGGDGVGEGDFAGNDGERINGSEGLEGRDVGTQVARAKEEAKSARISGDTEAKAPQTPLAPAASGHEGKADAEARTQRAKVVREHEPQSETDELVPRAAHDASAGTEK